jgi:putative tricarboxylic transport membrane protein
MERDGYGVVSRLESAMLALALFCFAASSSAQGWSPQKNVEIVVTSAPGGSNDKTARTVERILTAHKLAATSLTVVNKPGGGGRLAFAYVDQHAGDAHYLLIGTTGLLTGHIMGTNKMSYMDFTPIASLFNDYVVFAVNASSPIKTGKDLVERLKKDPKSMTLGVVAVGSHNHLAVGLVLKAAGGNPRDLKTVAFKGSSESIIALLGGHIELVPTAAGNAYGHVATGKLRVLGVAAPQRFGGALAHVPTWREQGIDVVMGGWRALVGPKGLTPAQVAYWEEVLRRATTTKEWKEDLEKNYWSDDFVTSAQFRKDLEKDYAAMKAVLTELGLAKQ